MYYLLTNLPNSMTVPPASASLRGRPRFRRAAVETGGGDTGLGDASPEFVRRRFNGRPVF